MGRMTHLIVICLAFVFFSAYNPVVGIVIATHCEMGILIGADSLETSGGVLVDQLYSQKIYQVSQSVYACFSNFDAASFRLCQSLRVAAKGAALQGRNLKVSEVAAYAQNIVSQMPTCPHVLIVGNEAKDEEEGREEGEDEDEEDEDGALDYSEGAGEIQRGHSAPSVIPHRHRSYRYRQKIFEISPSGFMTEQDLAATGAGANSALLLLDLSRSLAAEDAATASAGREGKGKDSMESASNTANWQHFDPFQSSSCGSMMMMNGENRENRDELRQRDHGNDHGGDEGKSRPCYRPGSMLRSRRKIHSLIRALRTADANVNGKVRMYLLPRSSSSSTSGSGFRQGIVTVQD